MVKLTGKCKKEFRNYLLKNDLISTWEYSIFERLSEVLKITYVVDFFDSVGIFISPKKCRFNEEWWYELKDENTLTGAGNAMVYTQTDVSIDRHDCLKKGIVFANEIYNFNKSK